MASPHLTDADIGRFLRRTLPAAELMPLSDHLAECAECRKRTAGPVDAADRAGALHDALGLGQDDHLSEADIQAFVGGGLDGDRRGAISTHLAKCPSCAEDIRDLTAFAATLDRPSQRRRSPWTYGLLAAAAMVVLAAGTALVWRGSRAPVATTVRVEDSGLDALNAAEVRDALQSGRLSLPPTLSELTGRKGILLGSGGDAAGFRLVSPVGTAVLETRPALRWMPSSPSENYIVTLSDQSTGETISSPPLPHTAWVPAQALARGHTYSWQVATTGTHEIVAPRPPDPPARFAVADEATALRFAHLPESPLARGILYANAGLLDNAEREFESITTGTDMPRVNAFLAQVHQARLPSGR